MRASGIVLASLAVSAALAGVGQRPKIVSPSAAEKDGLTESDCANRANIQLAGARIRVAFDPADFALTAPQICIWIVQSAQAVAGYFGRFPVRAVRIVLKVADGDRVSGGTTYGDRDGGGPLIEVRVGRSADQAALDGDWVMTHEMVHLSVPSVPRNSHWLEEGIATYVEPVARAQLGALSVQKVWADMFHGMSKGTPALDDRGLDYTPTWGRTYWGGALFCLTADVEIRRRTGNRKGLQDALRGVLAAGGSIEQDWPVARVLAAGDSAVGVPVLSELYERMGAAPTPSVSELQTLWQRLGVYDDGGETRLAADSPLSAVREAITMPMQEREEERTSGARALTPGASGGRR